MWSHDITGGCLAAPKNCYRLSLAPSLSVSPNLGLLDDDSVPAVRSWVERRTGELPPGSADVVRAWLLLLLDGDDRHRPRSPTSLYVYFGAVRPFLQQWAATHGHLREITAADVSAALEPLRGWQRCNALDALRSLFRFAKKRGLVFTDPTARLKAETADARMLPMTETEIRAVEQAAVNPAQRLIVALAALHAARPAAIRHLKLDGPRPRRLDASRSGGAGSTRGAADLARAREGAGGLPGDRRPIRRGAGIAGFGPCGRAVGPV